MKRKLSVLAGLFVIDPFVTPAQEAPNRPAIERTAPAADYRNVSGPVEVDFRGTSLADSARGKATVVWSAGRAAITARFENLQPPTTYGPQDLTYVLWAISAQGNARNLAELLGERPGEASIQATTELPVFGMILTAEPYAAVHRPEDLVVLENAIPPGGAIRPLVATVDLVPHQQYDYIVPVQVTEAGSNAAGLPRDRYQIRLAVAEARNAVQIAHASKAEQYASDSFNQAVQLLREAQQFEAHKADRQTILSTAHRAAQMAEGARAIASEGARSAAAGNAGAGPETGHNAYSVVVPALSTDPAKLELRARLLSQLRAIFPAVDTPQGLMVTVAGADFSGGALRPEMYQPLAQVAAILQAHPELAVAVESNRAAPQAKREALDRAVAVRDALVGGGAPTEAVRARNQADPDDLAAGTAPNPRVEMIVSGAAIGDVPTTDRSEAAPLQP